jgi:cell division protein ZapA
VTVRNKVEVRIAGKDYTLLGAESDEYMQKVALYVDKKMNEVLRTNNKLSTSMAAVLTALNTSDDFFRVRESEAALRGELKRVSDELEEVKNERKRLANENTALADRSTSLQLELAKRQAELQEVRNTFDKVTRDKL